MTTRRAFLKQAQLWLGKNEADKSHREIIDTYNAHKPLARNYKVKYGDSWCATFVSACAIKTGATDIIPTECSCGKMIELFKAKGIFQERDNYIPMSGDIIFYDWNDTGKGDNKGYPEHVGIVELVAGNTIVVIEGNYKDAVSRRKIQIDGKYIRGYGVPKFAPEEENSEFKSYLVRISANSLNVRAGAGVNYKINTVVRKGEVYTIVDEKMNGNTKWLKLKSGAGWISARYTERL